MASATPHTILLQKNGADRPVFELLAAGTITPGDVLDKASATTVVGATATNSPSNIMFAVEYGWADSLTAAAIDTDYTSGEQVQFIYAQPGDLVYGTLVDGDGAVAANAALTYSATAGHVASVVADGTTVVGDLLGYAEEAADSTSAAVRIKIRVA